MSAAATRPTTHVAVAVMIDAAGKVLLSDRPADKPYAGYWEFPGGKIEPGESVEAALRRELHEELGVAIGRPLPWVTFEFDYPHAYVRLHFCRIWDWRGRPTAREGQRWAFFDLDETPPGPLLPAAVPALRWLRLPQSLLIRPDGAAETFEAAVPRGAQIRLRTWNLDQLRAADHATARCTRQWDAGDADAGAVWAGTWAETEADLAHAASIGLDFALYGSPGVPLDAPLPVYVAAKSWRALRDGGARGSAHGSLIEERTGRS